jgi:uncharacterized protein (DUF1810 family)
VRAYLDHPVLGPRYREAQAAVLAQLAKGTSLSHLLGPIDAAKFRSSAATFARVARSRDMVVQQKEKAV